MAKNIINRVHRNLGRRLHEARREAGLSTRAIAAKLPRRLAVSHSTIASYEAGITVPPVDVLAAFAEIYNRPLNWFLENRESLSGFRFRNLKARVPLTEQRQFEAITGKWVEAYFRLERHLQTRRPTNVFTTDESLSPQALAEIVRKNMLNLDDKQPIQNMIAVLESFSAWALEIKSSFRVDGAAARHGDKYIVILNPSIANDRVRMNAALELAYILFEGLGHTAGLTESGVEKKAYAFASSLLLPDSQLQEAFSGRSFLKLIQYRERFGVSLAAMIYMAEQSQIINTTTSRRLWAEMAQKGWREIEPGYVWRDRAINFETMLECAIQTKQMTWADAERITGIREDELRQRIINAMQSEGTQLANGDVITLRFPPKTKPDEENQRIAD